MPALIFGVLGAATIVYLAMRNSSPGTIDTTVPTPDTAGIKDENVTTVPDAVAGSVPSNDDGATMSADDFNPGVSSPIVPTDSNTWPGGDAIWDVARAIAHQEGYGVSLLNAPTRNCNPGDLSDGFSQFGGEQLDSKITRFPDHETGWNWLYNKLKRVHDGRSTVFSNNMTWAQFGRKYASDQNWANGMTKWLGSGVTPDDRVGDYWNA